MVLLLLAVVLAGQAQGDLNVIPATEDVYINMGENNLSVFNQSDFLLCSIDVVDANQTGVNQSREFSYPGAPVIQFDISDLSLSQDDMAVLLLKAESIRKGSDPVMATLLTIASDWDENSDYTTFLINLLPAWNILKENDATAYSSNTDGDFVFAFDVSKKLQDARAKGDRISFLLQAYSNSSAEIAFFSRESGRGPCLVIMPYPQADENATMDMPSMEEMGSRADMSGSLEPGGMGSKLQLGNMSGSLEPGGMGSKLQLGNMSGSLEPGGMGSKLQLGNMSGSLEPGGMGSKLQLGNMSSAWPPENMSRTMNLSNISDMMQTGRMNLSE
jgi:hypothetical protein